jgi:L,D-transpeptidase ErfK/SrfK
MKFSSDHRHSLFSSSFLLLLVLLSFTLLFVGPACADVREDAEAVVAHLHLQSAEQQFPDDMKSLDLVLEVAQRYFMVGEQENADKFFLLALQKAQIIELRFNTHEAASLPDGGDVPSASGQALSAEPAEGEPSLEPSSEPHSARLVGSQGTYTVVRGDTFRLVAAKLGVTQQHLAAVNNLDTKGSLKVGQKLAYNNRKIIPRRVRDGIIVNIPDRTLYYFQQGALVTALPVALGSVVKNDKYVWQTPLGKFKVTGKIKDPTWTVPASIKNEMEERGKEVTVSVPPGPSNPLGKYAIKTSLPGIMIHSTIRPSSIYSFSSHGCIRVSPDQMEGFFPKVKVNTSGEIIYKPVKLAVTENGRIFLEVHQDIYKKSVNLVEEARLMVEKQNLSGRVDWKKFEAVLKQKRGIAEDISL